MLLGGCLETALCLDDLGVHEGLHAQLNLDLLQLFPLLRDALQPLLQQILAEPPTPVDRNGTEVLQSPRPFLHKERTIMSLPRGAKNHAFSVYQKQACRARTS